MPKERACARRVGCTNNDHVCLVCPYKITCPACAAPIGAPCRRPSGHNCTIHIQRVEWADGQALVHHRGAVVAQLGEKATAEWEARLDLP
jgi:hypothetical protein